MVSDTSPLFRTTEPPLDCRSTETISTTGSFFSKTEMKKAPVAGGNVGGCGAWAWLDSTIPGKSVTASTFVVSISHLKGKGGHVTRCLSTELRNAQGS